MKYDILIKDSSLMLNYEEIVKHASVAIKDGVIQAVWTEDASRKRNLLSGNLPEGEAVSAETELFGKNRLYMPGLIDSHMHTGQQLLKGLVLDAKPIIWTRIMLPFESTLTPEKMRLSAEVAALEMMKSGTAGFIDAGSYFMEEAAAVYEKSGLRGALSYSTMDEKGLPESIAMDAREAVACTDRLYDAFHGRGGGRLKVYYALRALNSCSDRLVELSVDHAKIRNAMLQAHMNEYQGEVDGILNRTGVRPYEYLEQMGALSEKFLGAHSLMLSEHEKELLQTHRVRVCHCPFSNCGKAVPDTPKLLSMGIPVGLGTDGAAHGGLSLFNEMKIFRSIMNIYHGVPNRNPKVMPAEHIFKIVLEGGAAALDEAGSLGRIEAGYKADLIGIDLAKPHLMPTGNLLHTIFECANANDTEDMIVAGKLIMQNREVKTLDEERILYDAAKYMEKEFGN